MFTGIIEATGIVTQTKYEHHNLTLEIEAPFSDELIIGQSIAHNGVCLTVTQISAPVYSVTAVEETLRLTNLGQLKVGDSVNLERCMPANGRFDGHIVQGHVDLKAVCTERVALEGSTCFTFHYPRESGQMTVHKGSITVNGVSLTITESKEDAFSIVVIPHTLHVTNLSQVMPGDEVNIEFDILGKYIQKMMGR